MPVLSLGQIVSNATTMAGGRTPQYRAGLFDGEGSVTVVKCSKRTSCWQAAIIPVLCMGNTDPQLLSVMKDAYGGFVYAQRKHPRRKQAYTWSLRGSKRVIAALADMLPFLIGKLERAHVAMVMLKTYGRHVGHNKIPEEALRIRTACFHRLRSLNKRGD